MIAVNALLTYGTYISPNVVNMVMENTIHIKLTFSSASKPINIYIYIYRATINTTFSDPTLARPLQPYIRLHTLAHACPDESKNVSTRL
jgi:hypothetical protein